MSTPKDFHPNPVTPEPSCPKDKQDQLSEAEKWGNRLEPDSNRGQNLARETRSLKRARLANQVFNLVGILGVVLTIWLIYAAYQRGLLSSQENLEAFLRGFGG
ncbi:hypothetical protein ACYCEV_09735, partial [Aerococcus mictus]